MATQLSHSLPVINHKPSPYDGPSRDEVLALRHQYLSPGIITYYRDPLMIVEGKMQYVWDEKGRRYLDALRRAGHGDVAATRRGLERLAEYETIVALTLPLEA